MSRNAGKKPNPLIKSTSQKNGIVEKNQGTILFCIFVISLVSRLPLIWNNLPPYQFCDETIYFEEVMRMILTGDVLPNEYRAGGFNLYPAFYLLKILNFFQKFIPKIFLYLYLPYLLEKRVKKKLDLDNYFLKKSLTYNKTQII